MVDVTPITKSLRPAGRLVIDPTDLGIAFPHGGTFLGHAARIELVFNQSIREIPDEFLGGEPIEDIIRHENPILIVVIRALPEEALKTVFAGFTAGVSGAPVPAYPSGSKGRLGSDSRVKILYSPRDAANHPGLIFYSAVPAFDVASRLQMMIGADLGFAIAFRGRRDGSDRVYAGPARFSDLSL